MNISKGTSRIKNNLLIVDDEPLNITALVRILNNEYTCYVARSGAEALELARELSPDVILLDVIMQDMDGYEVLTRLKNSKETAEIPVIFVTGLDSNESEVKGLTLGAADYVNRLLPAAIIRLRVRNQVQLVNQFRTILSLNEQLETAIKKASEATRAKSEFLAKMSHEIRTPMNAILGVSEILTRDENLASDVRGGVHMIHNSSELLLGILNDILDLSKVESGDLSLFPEEYSVVGLVSDTVQLNMMRLDNKPVEFKLRVSSDMPSSLIGDSIRIKQILNNLLSNAVKYTFAGQIRLEVKFKEESENASGRLTFVVSDTGMGMTEEQVDRIFDVYSRFHEGTETYIQGTGLGMNIVWNLINLMKGEIKVASQPNAGTVITVHIPQESCKAPAIGTDVAEDLRKLRFGRVMHINRTFTQAIMPHGTVLIVDDTDSNLYVAENLIKPYGITVETVSSGMDAIAKIKSGNVYDIIFMDHMMPKMDGVEATQLLRNLGYIHPIVALTANAAAFQMDFYLENGFDGFLAKPIIMHKLDSILRKLIMAEYPDKHLHKEIQVEYNKQNRDDALMLPVVRDIDKGISAMKILMQNEDNYSDEDLSMYTISAHSLKSVLLMIDERDLSEMARALENAGINKDMDFIFQKTNEFIETLTSIVEKIRQTKEGNLEPADEDKGLLRTNLQAIQKACVDCDADVAENLLILLKKHEWTTATREALEEIDMHLLHGDYEEAANIAQAYIDWV